ncbi:MAG: hypothetical protein NC320_05235 [Clostridium sp.]|nr:hypothetical protein [Clostridium sp.]MCM1547389.1 hypothetical protein [Ruminococcus sp.]
MRKFWTYIKNDDFFVGCSGQTVYVYDKNENELAKFKDIKYAYDAAFSPTENILAVKSTEVWLAFYSLDSMELIKKIRLRKPNSQPQDQGFAFSPDGSLFYNIEYQNDLTTHIVVYETESFTESDRFFEGKNIVFCQIEFENQKCFLTGFERMKNRNKYFVAEFSGGNLLNLKEVDERKFNYINICKELELRGFTEKSIEWSYIDEWSHMNKNDIKTVKLSDLYSYHT